MNQADYPGFVALWTQVYDLYGKSPSDGALDLTFNALMRFELEDIRRALTAHVNDTKHGDFVPKPADIVRNIEGDSGSRALNAWSKVEMAIRSIGHYQTVVFDDPRIMIAIEDMGGWIKLCEVTEKELPFKRNEFVNRYEAYVTRPPERYPAKLIGETEAHNRGEYEEFVPEPRLIGNPQRCLAVMKQGDERKPSVLTLSEAMNSITANLEHKGDVA